MQRHGGRGTQTGLKVVALVLGVVCALLMALGPALAQDRFVTVDHPAGLTRLIVEAPQLIAVEGGGGGSDGDSGDGGSGGDDDFDEPIDEPVAVMPAQDDAEFIYRPGGRFQFGTGTSAAVGGNPLVAGDEGRSIASIRATGPNWDLTAFTSTLTLSVDGTTYDPYLQQYNQQPQADPADLPLFWVQDLVGGTRDVLGEVLVPLTTDVPTEGSPNVRIRVNYTLVHDALMIEHIVYNDDTAAHSIGLRLLIDALFGAAIRDGSPIILDDGTVITNETRIPDPDNPTIAMPDTWVAHDNPDSPLVSVRGTIVGDEVTDPGIASEAGGVPDEIAFGQYRNMAMGGQFDFRPNPRASILNEDWAYAVKWEERPLQPGQSRRYVTYYGLGAAAVDYDPPYALAAYAPNQLEVQEGDDPATPETEEYFLSEGDGDSVFDVVVMLDNFGTSALNNATVRISLPEGLELYPETQPRTISLGLIQRNQSPLPMAQWSVRATAARPGTAEISITGPLGKVVRRQINIPAIPIIPARESITGLEMLSVPYQFANSDASNVLGSLSDSVFPGGPVAIWRWHPGLEHYFSYPDPFVANIELGEGFWLLNENGETIVLPDGATTAPDNQPFTIPLEAGWNQIGNPHVVPTRLDQVMVVGPQGSQWSITEASQRGLILPTLYSYNPTTNEYEWESSLQAARVIPFEGYWILALQDVTLSFPPPSMISPAQEDAVSTAAATTDDDGWRVGIEVQSAGRTRAPRYFGVSPSATDGADVADVPAPPQMLTAGPQVDAFFTIGEADGVRYLADTRSAGDANAWDLTVVGGAPGAPVTLRWPDLGATLPDDLVAILEDVDAGRSVYMRTSSAYTYNSNTGGERHFRVRVRPRAQATLGLTASTRAAAGTGVEIVYSLGSAASVDVEVRNIAGRIVRRLAQNHQSVEGQNTLVWNGISDAGTAVPAGTYLIQVTARSPETGEQSSVVRTATIGR